MITKNLELQETIVDRFNTLNKQGGASEIQYLQQKNRSLELEGKLKQVRVERLRQQAFQQQQIKQLKAELEELNARITESNVNLRYQVLKAPVDGVVFDLQPRGSGYVARGTETVMKIVPHDTLQAKVEIPSSHIGFVKVGMPADLSIILSQQQIWGSKGEVKSTDQMHSPQASLITVLNTGTQRRLNSPSNNS